MRDPMRPSSLLAVIAVTAVIAAAALGSTGASGTGGEGRTSCPPTVTEHHYTLSLDLRCTRGPEKAAAGARRKAGS